MRLFAISDLHLDHGVNGRALEEMPNHGDDWLILGGDLCTKGQHLESALASLSTRFAKLFWVPGNHELWTSKEGGSFLKGQAKYLHLVDIARSFGVHTPEDPFVVWPGDGSLIAPLFIPYDYSFRPDQVPLEKAIDWAMESGVLCNDERLLDPEPYAGMPEWCEARLAYSQARLSEAGNRGPKILINHFPLRQDLVRLEIPRRPIPRFSIWCGTRATEDFHRNYGACVVISGHLHMRATDYRDGVRFEEVSLGYPQHWNQAKGMAYYLREIKPDPSPPVTADTEPIWRFY